MTQELHVETLNLVRLVLQGETQLAVDTVADLDRDTLFAYVCSLVALDAGRIAGTYGADALYFLDEQISALRQ